MKDLGRMRRKALRAYDLIRETDFKSVNLDLIFEYLIRPNQWHADMEKAVESNHLSTYA